MGTSLGALHRWIASRATPGTLALGGLLWVASALGVRFFQARVTAHSGGLTVPDVDPYYDPAELYDLLERFGASGRKAFLEFTIYDLYYPFVAYGVAAVAIVLLTRSLADSRPRLVWALAVPVAGLVVELLEQACFLGALLLFPSPPLALAVAASILTPLKFALIFVLVSLIVALGIWRGIRFASETREAE